MAGSLRIQYPGALYLLTCWGNERKDIFRNDDDRQVFLCRRSRFLNACSVLSRYLHLNPIRVHTFEAESHQAEGRMPSALFLEQPARLSRQDQARWHGGVLTPSMQW